MAPVWLPLLPWLLAALPAPAVLLLSLELLPVFELAPLLAEDVLASLAGVLAVLELLLVVELLVVAGLGGCGRVGLLALGQPASSRQAQLIAALVQAARRRPDVGWTVITVIIPEPWLFVPRPLSPIGGGPSLTLLSP